jgi:hypothetical protein
MAKPAQMHIGNNIETPFSQNYNVHFCIRKFLDKLGYAEFTSDIPGFVAGRDIQVLLNLYEARFLPAAAGQLAAAQFQRAAQMDGEQIAVWHSRSSSEPFLEKIYKTQDSSLTNSS